MKIIRWIWNTNSNARKISQNSQKKKKKHSTLIHWDFYIVALLSSKYAKPNKTNLVKNHSTTYFLLVNFIHVLKMLQNHAETTV